MANELVSRKFSSAYYKKGVALAGAIALAAVSMSSTQAATTTSNLSVQLVISASCAIGTVNNLDFGTATTPLSANIDTTSTLDVTCSNTTPYNIGLDAGTTVGGTIATRLMFNGGTAATVQYRMYSNAARTNTWGDVIGTNTVAATGSGSAQTYTIYGRVPAQTTPAPATYTDTVTVTVTY